MSTAIRLEATGLRDLQAALLQATNLPAEELLDAVGALVASQTQRRISEDKESPEGVTWPAWSRRYARTRHSGQSLLQGEGGLVESIQHLVYGAEAVEIGSNLVYAATHQFGDPARRVKGQTWSIPARPYLGLSTDDLDELEALILDMVRGAE